jgi:hypothetical protein
MRTDRWWVLALLLAAGGARGAELGAAGTAPGEAPSEAVARARWEREQLFFSAEDGRFFLGRALLPVGGAGFYQVVGREDLVDAYWSRRSLKVGLTVGGGAAALGGIFLGSAALIAPCQPEGVPLTECLDRNRPAVVSGGLLAALGLGAMVWGLVLDSEPVDLPGRMDLARDYNTRLRRGLGLPEAQGPRGGHLLPPGASLRLAGGVWPGARGAAVAGLAVELRL